MRRVGRRGRRRRCGPAGALASSMSVVRETRVSCQTVHERRAGRSSFGSPIHPGSMSSRVGSRAGSRPEARARRQRTGRQRLRHEGSDEELGGRRSALRATRRSGELRARYAGRTLGRSLTPSYTGIRAPQTKHRGAPGIRAARHETSRKGPTVDRLPLLHGHSRPAGSWNESSRRVAPQERIISISAHLDSLFRDTRVQVGEGTCVPRPRASVAAGWSSHPWPSYGVASPHGASRGGVRPALRSGIAPLLDAAGQLTNDVAV